MNSCRGTQMINVAHWNEDYFLFVGTVRRWWRRTCTVFSCGWGCREVHGKHLFSRVSLSSSVSPLSQMMTVSRIHRIRFAPRLPMASGPRSFDENSRKAVKEEKIKSAALSALVSADPPWESLWDHNTSHKTAGARPAVWKGPASHWAREQRTGEGKEWREKKSFSYTQVEWGS